MSKGCVLDLKMRDKQGTVVTDYSRYGNDGAVNGGVVWTEKGMRFDGSSGYLNCVNDESLNLGTEFTLCCWAKINLDSSWHGIFAKGYSYRIAISPTNSISFWTKDSDGDSIDKLVSLIPYDGQWIHIVQTVNASTNPQLIGYINGINKITGYNVLYDGAYPTSSSLYIGRDDALARYYNSQINDVRIYNYALPLREIKAMYNAEKHKYV